MLIKCALDTVSQFPNRPSLGLLAAVVAISVSAGPVDLCAKEGLPYALMTHPPRFDFGGLGRRWIFGNGHTGLQMI